MGAIPNPYPGPRPFTREEHNKFAGRDHEVSELTSLVISHQVVLLFAQSGTGKTSLVNAGLSNALTERGVRLLPIARVGNPIPDQILKQISNVYAFSMACDILPQFAVTDEWRRNATLVEAFRFIPEALDQTGDRIPSVCVIDQFEELFFVHPERWRDRKSFFVAIAELLEKRRDLGILFVLREDFLAPFDQLAPLLPEHVRTRLHLERLREDEAISSIHKPLEGTPYSFAPGVAEALVDDLATSTVQGPSSEADTIRVRGEFVEPVQLQAVCYSLFESLPENVTVITHEVYKQFGNPDDALLKFYDRVLEDVTQSTDVSEAELRQWFDKELITSTGMRRPALPDHTTDSTQGMRNDVVRLLEKHHLIRSEITPSGSRWYELTHDRFIGPIQGSNREWRSRIELPSGRDTPRLPLHSLPSRLRAASRGIARAGDILLPSLPPEFLRSGSRVAEEIIFEPTASSRDGSLRSYDFEYDVEPGCTALLAVRHPSSALTFHPPIKSAAGIFRHPAKVRFQVTIRQHDTRGAVSQAVKVIVIKVPKVAARKAASFVLSKLVKSLEKAFWKKRRLTEGWLKVTRETLADGVLERGRPVSPKRSLLLLHGPFSNTASTYGDLTKSKFFDQIKDAYEDRIFGFDHFSLCRTPEDNARMLLEGLPEQSTTFDVITHSRGGLVLRNLVERASEFGAASRRFKLGRAVLVASPNDGTPLATPKRWDETIGWIANLLEMFPENPFTTGPEFVANGLVWLANHAAGDLPGLRSMDGEGDLITAIQGPPGPPSNAYSALVANYHPDDTILHRLLDAGLDQFFGSANDLVVPSEGGWRIDRSNTTFIPASRIGCFGPGGNLPLDSVTHVSFFSHAETADFLVNALSGRQQPLKTVDPRKSLPDRRLLRGARAGAVATRPTALAAASLAPKAAVRHEQAPAEKPLRITVTNGDLTFEPEALLLGHYSATRLTGTERIMNDLIGGAMGHSLDVGLYPLAVGSHQIFINTRSNLEKGSILPRPKAVIVVGLGAEGKLQAVHLVRTVRQGVIAWAQRLAENKKGGRDFELAATLIGSGGTGVSAGESARLVAQGVYEANELLKNEHDSDEHWPRVSHLNLIELYLDRATEAWRLLRMQETATTGRYEISDAVKTGTGPLQRPPDWGYRGADYDFITVETKEEKDGAPLVSYTLNTWRASIEVRGQRTQSQLLKELVATASNDQNRDEQIGRTLFNLLIPIEIEAYLVGSGEMRIELDPATARIPWELLDTHSDDDADPRPWAIKVKLLRKLRIEGFREHVTDADADASALVIGEPESTNEYPRLYGARREAVAVQANLTGPAGLDPSMVTALISPDPSEVGADARTVINALLERPWRIVHIAGHGAPTAEGKPGGVVLSNGTFLGPDEIRNMRVVPELVFVNCCYLASGDPNQLLNLRFDRANFASGVAGALIDIGVRCVIAAGWAVDDDAAIIFAETFYTSLLRGNRFLDAVAEAREEAYQQKPQVNTWAAYQCYGDPDWVFRRKAADANRFTAPLIDEFSSVASVTSLKLALERIIVGTKFQGIDPEDQRNRLQQLEEKFGQGWGKSGSVAELFGEAFVEVGAVESGMHWYERAVTAPDGRASMKAAEQLANVRGRLGWEIVDKAQRHRDEMKERLDSTPKTPKARAAARRALADAEKRLRESSGTARQLVRDSLGLLRKLGAVETTMVRESLVGSAHKRLALIDAAVGTRRQVEQDLRQMKASYQRAWDLGRKSGATDLYYPAANCLVADVALNAGRRGWRGFDREILDSVQQGLNAKNGNDADFWSIIGAIELRQYRALAARKLASEKGPLERAYQDLRKRAKATRMWGSVYDTAFLVFRNYAVRASGREKDAANALLELLRTFAQPDGEQ